MVATCRAIRVAAFGGPSVLQVGRVELPALGEREVLVKIHAVGVNPQETYVRAGNYAQLPALPWTPGKDAAGVVVDSKSARWRAGDRVFTMLTKTGAYAEMAVAAEDQLFRLPDRVSFAHGAGLGVAFVAAYRALFEKARARPGQSLLVHGASGGVGTLVLQMALAHGCGPIVGTAGSEAGVEMLRREFPEIGVLNHRSPVSTESAAGAAVPGSTVSGGAAAPPEHHLNAPLEALNASGVFAANPVRPEGLQRRPVNNALGFDIIVEMQGQMNLGADIEHLLPGGTIVVVGNRGTELAGVNARALMQMEGSIVGVMGRGADAKLHREQEAAMQAFLQKGIIRPIIAKEFQGLSELPAAHEEVIAHAAGTAGRLVVLPWGDADDVGEL